MPSYKMANKEKNVQNKQEPIEFLEEGSHTVETNI